MGEQDWEPLGEDVSGHTVMGMHRHDDGRGCVHHSRLGAWAFGWPIDKRCLRDDHPDPYARRTNPPAPEASAGVGEGVG